MGTGRFKDGKFDLTAVANFFMMPADWTEWERCFNKASEILYNASEGQMCFGKIFICDEGNGLDTADLILYPAGDPSYNSGRFGILGGAIHLMPYVKRQVLSLIHEMGHHVWDLGDEYSAPYIYDDIDDSSPAPDKVTIPILDSGRANNELANQNAQALLMFGDLYERRNIIADTSTSITVDSDYSDLPTNADGGWVLIQIPAECSNVANSNYCIMEKSRRAAGSFNDAGVWTDAAHPVTEFCTASNHDPDNDTDQEGEHGKSCWETITDRAEFSTLVVPDPASGVLPAGHVGPTFYELDKPPRFALVLDRSGSMATGHKMADAQHGTVYWLEFCSLGADLLTIIWYDHVIDRILDLTEVGTLPDLDTQIDSINLLTPRGTTNIRDGLFEGLDQIQTLATRAGVQVALLLTDGKHNTPVGSEASEVLPAFKEAGVRIYTLGVGASDVVDMDVLDELAEETGGISYAVGDDEPGLVEAAMVEINAVVRGGIITTSPQLFPDSSEMKLDEIIKDIMLTYKERRPPFEVIHEIIHKMLGLEDINHVIHPSGRLKGIIASIPVDIEERCERASFSLVYPQSNKLWLYLLNPRGHFVDMSSPTVKHVISNAPHEFAVVDRPEPGRWYIVALRVSTGRAFSFKAIAGGENRAIQVFGGATSKNALNAPVWIHASARYKEILSGLRVTATVISPDGIKKQITLNDSSLEEPNSGEYESFVIAEKAGRYQGIIRIQNTGKAIMAKPVRRLFDSKKKEIKVRVKAPKFVRLIPFSFDAGKRPEVKDMEREKGLNRIYGHARKRPAKLVSAKADTEKLS